MGRYAVMLVFEVGDGKMPRGADVLDRMRLGDKAVHRFSYCDGRSLTVIVDWSAGSAGQATGRSAGSSRATRRRPRATASSLAPRNESLEMSRTGSATGFTFPPLATLLLRILPAGSGGNNQSRQASRAAGPAAGAAGPGAMLPA